MDVTIGLIYLNYSWRTYNFKNPLVVKGNTLYKGQDKARWSQKVDRHARLSNILIFNYINYRLDE